MVLEIVLEEDPVSDIDEDDDCVAHDLIEAGLSRKCVYCCISIFAFHVK